MRKTAYLFLGVLVLGASLLLMKAFSGDVVLVNNFIVAGISIHYYGLILGLASLSAYILARHRAEKYGITASEVDDISMWVIISGFIGARFYHVVSSWDYYIFNPVEAFFVWNGGLSIFGAILGGLVGLYFYRKFKNSNLKYFSILDWLAPSVILGQIIGRFGNLVNYEAYGIPTDLPWKMFVPLINRLSPYEAFEFFHPLFLYEALAGLLILLILLNFSRLNKYLNLPRFSGQIFWLWIGLYGLVRIFTEYLRVDSPYLGSFKQNMLVAALMVGVAVFLTIINIRNQKKVEHESIPS
ncbi:MAG TPA: prolipoprotein diacylglyceryl transferase [Candidatus Doudnabacteria bacterium]|nr:prolipoprotein diacylglyceryl transferase [Candidatus Doudnabacteria bacterium]